jgi:hypothetical protein
MCRALSDCWQRGHCELSIIHACMELTLPTPTHLQTSKAQFTV